MNRIEIHTCTQVCRLWKEFCDTLFQTPHVFNGRHKLTSMARSKQDCRLFLTNHLLAADNRRHFKLYFYNVENWQMKTIAEENPKEFNNAVRHITKLHLVNCNLHWQTLINLLLNLTHLHTFTDTWSCHFQYASCLCFYQPHTSQGSLKNLEEKLALNELKNKCTRCRVFKLSRKSLTKELCIYFHLIPKLIPYLEEFEFNLGPSPKRSRREVPVVQQWLEEFSKVFKTGMRQMRKYLKRLRIYWDDRYLSNLFDKLVGAIHTTEFPKLVEFFIRMNEKGMKHPGKLPEFVRFINSFELKDKSKGTRLPLKLYISPIYVTEEWNEFLGTIQDRIVQRKSRVSLRFEVHVDDCLISDTERAMIAGIFKNFVFFRGMSKLQVNT